MRIVGAPGEMRAAFGLAREEARGAFGDPDLYIEKYIERPRHIEIQIIADHDGHVIHLGERECSVQRRHQKVIEECPASFDDAALRNRMGEAAVAIARAAGYTSLGTIEFLVDAARNFYFLEMNTRLQVEHPVTEMVTGVDLVGEQIRIAAGEPLRLRQEDVRWRGSAIECRVYAEDPARNFMPSPGRITRLRAPSGPGVRDDGGVYEGWEVPIHYDPLISKLAAWGATRDEAIARLQRALAEYEVGGIQTTIPFFREVLADEEFRGGETDTGFIARFLDRRSSSNERAPKVEDEEEIAAAALAAALAYAQGAKASTAQLAPQGASRWKSSGRLANLKH
jgi:acetyl-CoA carboxylase biotin carboxylase subunit